MFELVTFFSGPPPNPPMGNPSAYSLMLLSIRHWETIVQRHRFGHVAGQIRTAEVDDSLLAKPHGHRSILKVGLMSCRLPNQFQRKYNHEHIPETLNGDFSTAGTLFNGRGDNDYGDFSCPLTRQCLLAITDCLCHGILSQC